MQKKPGSRSPLAAVILVMSAFFLSGLLLGSPVVERTVAALDQPWLRKALELPVSSLTTVSRFLGLYDLNQALHGAWLEGLQPGSMGTVRNGPAGPDGQPGSPPAAPPGSPPAAPPGSPAGSGMTGTPDSLSSGSTGSLPFGPDHPLSLLVIGDSQAMGPDFAFKRDVGKDPWYRYQGEYRLSASLANPGVHDWPARLDALLTEEHRDVLVVYLGSNDAQAVRDGDGQAEFDSPAWHRIMKTRIRAFMARACEGAGRVWWMACPPMRDPGFNRKIQVINRLYRDCAAEFSQVSWIEYRDLLYSDHGDYLQGKEINGRQVQLRKEDGIHLSRTGYEYMCARLLARIETELAFRRPRPVYPIFGETLSGL